jgi:hypothetical protein
MQIKNFWVGEQPGGNWTFTVLDQRSGNPVDLTQFNNAKQQPSGPQDDRAGNSSS